MVCLRLMSLTILVLASHVMLSEAAVRVWGLRAINLEGDPWGNPPDPYLRVWCGGTSGGWTESIKDTSHPTWSAQFSFSDCSAGETLELEVWDRDLQFDDHLGTCTNIVTTGTTRYCVCPLSQGTFYYTYAAE